MITKTNHPYTFTDGTVSMRGLSCGGITVILAKLLYDTNTVYIHDSKSGMRMPITEIKHPPEDAFFLISKQIEAATFKLEDWVDPDLFDDRPRTEPTTWGEF